MPNYDFKKDFPIAKMTEQEVASILKKKYSAKIIEFGKTIEYDIIAEVNNKEYKFEVKEDFTCQRTGNVGLEFECRGKPSGIQASKADFYIYKIHTKHDGICFYLCSTKTLKKMIEEKEYFIIVNGGDKGSNSMNYLFKYETFIRNAKLIAKSP